MKIQKGLIDKTKKYNELKSLVSEIKHLEEMAGLHRKNHKLLVQLRVPGVGPHEVVEMEQIIAAFRL